MPPIIDIKNLYFTYLPGSPYERQALKNINFSLETGELLGIFGPNGSGKSTLVQHLNGLLLPSSGIVKVCNTDTADSKSRHELWKKVSLVFQYPEQQIFQTTVYDEIAYGPRNLGISEAEVQARVTAAMEKVELDPKSISGWAPYSLSGGMKRRVAIAGLLALNPEILVLDEPMAGLDPLGRRLILDMIKSRHDKNETTVMISHNLKDIMALADKIAILDQGSLLYFGTVAQLLENKDLLSHYRLELPQYLQLVYTLADKGFAMKADVSNMAEAGKAIARML
ncbi:MAG: energy-coupling factor transporter ATPase [Syntrophomonadaceae bacterium]|jgi:energy-coupling factor transport system ATP-binding protein